MKNAYQEHMPKISLTVLATLCFVTLIMCQTRFKISKEMNREVYPPIMRTKDCWFLYTIGNPDSFKCVLRVFVVITSPVLSLISTALVLLGKMESNPYFFIPWLFLTLKGLLLVQTDNLITILKEMSTRENYTFGFRAEDLKWMLFYFTIFMIDLVETFSFCEIFDLFLVLWNHYPKFTGDSANLEAVKKDIADIMKSLSKCSLGSLSKISLGSSSDSEETNESNLKELESSMKFSGKEEDLCEAKEAMSKGDGVTKCEFGQTFSKSSVEEDAKNGTAFSVKAVSEKEGAPPGEYEKMSKTGVGDSAEFEALSTHRIKLKGISSADVREEFKSSADLSGGMLQTRDYSANIMCS